MEANFTYRAVVRRVVDGDTLDLDIQLGFHMLAQIRVRLARIDAPEKSQGALAIGFLMVYLNKPVVVQTTKTEKYGRWLAEVEVDGINLSTELLARNYVKPYDGGKR